MFMAKYIFKLHMRGSDRTVVIKIPLVREVMPKGELAAFLRSRDEQRSSRRSTLASSSRRSASRSSPRRLSAIGGLQEEHPGTARVVPHEGTHQEEQGNTAHALGPPDER